MQKRDPKITDFGGEISDLKFWFCNLQVVQKSGTKCIFQEQCGTQAVIVFETSARPCKPSRKIFAKHAVLDFEKSD